MLDINDLLDYAQSDCVFDIYDCTTGKTIAKDLEREQLEEWHESHSYELLSFEPIQRVDEQDQTIFGIVWNVDNVEETRFVVKYMTYVQYNGGELELDEEIEEEYDTEEIAKTEARKNKYGVRGQYVEVYVNDKYFRDYELR